MDKQRFLSFDVDRGNQKITVRREFAADKNRVWQAWTTSEMLDKWWAPNPWVAVTQSMDFSEGGAWFYYMKGPDGERHYSRADYDEIDTGNRYSGYDAFVDADGNILEDMPRTFWLVGFEESDGHTFVNIELRFDKTEDLEKTLEMGFEEGFAMGMRNLDGVLADW